MKKVIVSIISILVFSITTFAQGTCGTKCTPLSHGMNAAYTLICNKAYSGITYAFRNHSRHMSKAESHRAARRAFQTWQNATGKTFREVSINKSPDLVISWETASASNHLSEGTLAVAFVSCTKRASIKVNDSDHRWSNNFQSGTHDLESVLLHEIGHVLGLGHSQRKNVVMSPTISAEENQRTLQAADIAGAKHLFPMFYKRNRWQARLSNGQSFIYQGPDKWETSTRSKEVKTVGTGDFNGDGKDDLLLTFPYQGRTIWQARISDGNTLKFQNSNWSASVPTIHPDVKVIGMADVNGDGRDDLVYTFPYQGRKYWRVFISKGNTFEPPKPGEWEVSVPTTDQRVSVVGIADVNGDGRDDLVYTFPYKGRKYWRALISKGNNFELPKNNNWETSTASLDVRTVGLADVNGDGKADLILQSKHEKGKTLWQARLSNGHTFAYQHGKWETFVRYRVLARAIGLADVNGDNIDDLVITYFSRTEGTVWEARLGSKTGFHRQNAHKFFHTSTRTQSGKAVALADVNGDGKADLVLNYQHEGKNRWQARLSQNNDFVYQGPGKWETSTATKGVKAVACSDFDGDGKADLLLNYYH